ncbi:MAG TPA: CmcI family methyltransferase [Pyrinomonadaceae bacterium]|nr:CmcI family methyltransferase [Pyrinomonadaceae bacterium]
MAEHFWLVERILNRLDRSRPVPSTRAQGRIVRRFHRLYYATSRRTWRNTFFLGVPVAKCPLDLWVYQEIIHEVRPDVIVETGTAHGGSALYMAATCEMVGCGRVISVDLAARANLPRHPRVTYVEGSSVARETFESVRSQIRPGERVMVVLDSDHSRQHVLAELRLYGELVTPGSYLVVEDTNVHGHPVFRSHGPGPHEAVADFLREDARFDADESREKFYMTFNPRGYLKRLPRPRA